MTEARYREIESDINARLTEEEMSEGWHFCFEFDGLLVKGDPKEEVCGKACIDWAGGL
jgi:hypothetical protein